jgi:hypothetical protein
VSGEDRPSDRRRRAAVPGTEGTTRDVRRPWKIGKARSKSAPYMVRWVVGDQVATRTFPSFALADTFRSDLIRAVSDGEAFDVATGLPASMIPVEEAAPPASWLDFCTDYVAARWDGAAAKTRDSITDSLATAAIALTDSTVDQLVPGEIRRAFLWAVLPANKELNLSLPRFDGQG